MFPLCIYRRCGITVTSNNTSHRRILFRTFSRYVSNDFWFSSVYDDVTEVSSVIVLDSTKKNSRNSKSSFFSFRGDIYFRDSYFGVGNKFNRGPLGKSSYFGKPTTFPPDTSNFSYIPTNFGDPIYFGELKK